MTAGSIAPDVRAGGRQDLLRAEFLWTRQIGGLTCHLGGAPVYLAARSQLMVESKAARCSSLASHPVCVTREWSTGEARYQGALWRQFFLVLAFRPCCRQESHDVTWLNSLRKPTWMGAQVAALDIHMTSSASTFQWSLPNEPDRRRHMNVSNLCQQGQLHKAVEALGILVQTDFRVSRSLFYTVLKTCFDKKDLVLGRRVHALSIEEGFESDTFLCNHIVRMYASHSRLQEAMDAFTFVAKPDAFMWSSILSAHVQLGQAKQAILLYHEMRRSSVKPDGHVFVAALRACAKGLDLKSGQQVHADLVASGVEPDMFVCSCLVDMYAKCGSLQDAQRVFDGLSKKDVVTWNAMIAAYSQQGMGQESLRLHRVMQQEGIAAPDSVTFVCLLQACAGVGIPALETGKQLHRQIEEQGLQADVVVGCSLVNMYAKCGSLQEAHSVFNTLPQKNVVTWTALIVGYSQQGMGQDALDLYSAMQEEGIDAPDSVSFACLLQACSNVGPLALENGKQLHAQIRERQLQDDAIIGCGLVHMYSKCGSVEDAQSVFDGLGQKDVVTWTALISGYVQQGRGHEALSLYSTMQEEGNVAPDTVTFMCLLQACADVAALHLGRQLHAQIRERGVESDLSVANKLIDMYARCNSLDDAQSVFDGLRQKDAVTWTTLITGYSRQGMGEKALNLYSSMQNEGIAAPDSVTFVSLLQACASVGLQALEKGKQLHAQIGERGLQVDVVLGSSLVTMYAKCGSLHDAQFVFDSLPQKNVVTWTALISGYSQQGMGEEALRLYSSMQQEGLAPPDSVTFVSLLQACASVAALHAGRQLHMQIEEQGLQADVLVAMSLVNMYARSASMTDAQQVFDTLPGRDVISWNALIAGYARHGQSEIVFDLVHRMREAGTRPNGVTFLSLLAVCSHAGLVTRGREYFEAMSGHYGISPSTEHYSCMVDLLGRAGHLDEALSVVKTMPLQPDAAVWYSLLGACQKWSNVEIGRLAFNEALKLNKTDSAPYVLMSNIYKASQMWEEAEEMQERRVGIGAWKEPGQSWWTDTGGLVHKFVVGDDRHPESEAIYSRLKELVPSMKEKGYVPLPDSSYRVTS